MIKHEFEMNQLKIHTNPKEKCFKHGSGNISSVSVSTPTDQSDSEYMVKSGFASSVEKRNRENNLDKRRQVLCKGCSRVRRIAELEGRARREAGR